MRFFLLTLEKIVVAKLIGLPLLLIDYLYKSFLTSSLFLNIIILVLASYLLSCGIVYFYEKRFKETVTINKR